MTPNSPGDQGYSASNPLVLPGSISEIGDSFGRSIVFTYNSAAGLLQGLLATISATGANGQSLTESYSYTSGTFAQDSLPLLQEVKTPDGLQTVYGYGSYPDESGTPYMYLTQIGYPTGAVSSYTYGSWSYTASTPPGVFEATGDWTSRTWSSVVVASHTLTLGASGAPGTASTLTWQYDHVSSLQNYLGRVVNGYAVQSMPVIVTDPLGTEEAHFIAFDDLLGSAGTLLPGGHEIAVIRYAPGDSCDTSTPTSPQGGRVFEKDLYYSSGQGVNDYERLGDAGHCGVYMGGTAWSSLDIVPNGNPRVWKVVEAEYSPTSEGTPLWSRETRNAFWDGFGHYMVSEVGQTSALAGTGASGQSYSVLRGTISQYTLLVTGTTTYQINQLAVRYKGGDSTNGPFPPANTPPAGTLAVSPLTTPLPSTDDGGGGSPSSTYAVTGGTLAAVGYLYNSQGLPSQKTEYATVATGVNAQWSHPVGGSWSWTLSAATTSGGDITTTYGYGTSSDQDLGDITSLSYSGPGNTYGISFGWDHGVVNSLQWSGSSYALWTRVIDPNTSLITSQTDAFTAGGGLTTHYYYDGADRLSIIAPPGGEYPVNIAYPTDSSSWGVSGIASWTTEHIIEYYKGQYAVSSGTVTGLPSDETQLATPSNFGSLDLYSKYTFDDLGRLWKTDTVRPDGGWREQVTLYDPLGRKLFSSLPYDPASPPGTSAVTYPLASGGGTFSLSVPVGSSGNPLGTWDMIQSGNPLSGWGTLDPFYRTVEVIRPDGSTTTTTYASQLDWTTTINGIGQGGESSSMEYTKDIVGDLLTATPSIGASGIYTYDGLGNLTSVDLNNQTRSYSYDAMGHLASQTNPETGTITYGSYDALGNLLSYTDAIGNTITEAYDFMGRRTGVSSNGQTLASWTYDGGPSGGGPYDRLTGTETTASPLTPAPPFGNGGTVSEAFTYDPNTGRLSGKTVSLAPGGHIPAESYTLSYQYDSMGDLTTEGVGGSTSFGYTLTSAYQHGGLLSKSFQDGQGVSGIQYFPSGSLQSLAYTNGTTTSFTQDAVERLHEISVANSSSTLWSTGLYTYDGAGNILSIGSDSFDYDQLSRLTSATVNHTPALGGAGQVQIGYTYDAWGNLISRTVENNSASWMGSTDESTFLAETNLTASYTPTNATTPTNQLQTLTMNGSASSISFDKNGNMLTEGGGNFTYDPLNQVQQAITPAISQTPSYTDYSFYDASGERVASVHTTTSTSQLNTVTYYARTGAQVLAEEHLALDGSTPADHVKAYLYVGSNLATSEEGDVGGGTGTTYSISGSVTVNGSGLTGVTVSAGSSGTATTDGNGNFTISGLANGTYTVTPSLSGYTFSPTSASETINGANLPGVNFTAVAAVTHNLSGTITLNGSGLSGVTVSAGSSGTATTDGNGNFTISGLANGTYTLTPSLTGYTFSPTSASETINGANITGINFAASAAICTAPSITTQPQSQTISSGQSASLSVTASGTPPLSYQWYQGTSGDVTDPIAGATAATFTTPALTATTSYWVQISNNCCAAPSITTQPQSSTITSGASATLSVVASGGTPLSYQWYQGASGDTSNPISGATAASFTTPALNATTTYWVQVSNGCGSPASSATATVTVQPGGSSFSISGTVTNTQGRGASGVTVSLSTGASVTTDSSGNYSFGGLSNGTYTVTPQQSSQLVIFIPSSQSVTVSGASVSGVDFSSRVVCIRCLNGLVTLQNGSPVVGVTLTAGALTATTDASGSYTFSNVPDGTYTIAPDAAASSAYTFTPASRQVNMQGQGQGQGNLDFKAHGKKEAQASASVEALEESTAIVDSQTATVTVSGTPTASASASPASGNAPLTVAFTGSATGGTAPYSYGWAFGDGGSASSQNPSHTYSTAGTYTATLTVTDSASKTATATVTVTVTTTGLAASASASPLSGAPPLTVSFTGSASGGTAPYSYSWSFGDGGTATGATASHTYTSVGSYTASLTVTDSANPQGTATRNLSISVASSPLVLTASITPLSGSVPLNVTYSASASGGTAPYSYSWAFGDGGTSAAGSGTHNYTAAGSYSASCTVTDGASGTASKSFTVTAAAATYSLSGTVTQGGSGLAGVTVALSGAASATTTTGSGGAYTFTGLANGSYTVTPSLSGYVFTPASASETVSGANVTGVNFSSSVQGVSGTITAVSGSLSEVLEGVTVTVSGSGGTYTGTTSSLGTYTIGGIPNGTVTVTPSLAGWTFNPPSQSVTVNGAYTTGVNFTGTPPAGTYTISGTITIGGILTGGVPVTLSEQGMPWSTTMFSGSPNSSGVYAFLGLGNGTYTVTAGQPTGIVITYNKTSKAETISGANLTGVNFSGSVCTKCTSGTVAL
ncbi:MAG: carboxypeptidase regulatory-like domain-containing protein, partial [Acidobacteriota bacterium]